MTGSWKLHLAAALLALSANRVLATPETDCQSGRAVAAGKYALCTQKAVARSALTAIPHTFDDTVAYNLAAGKCVTKYARTWDKLAARAAGTGATCDNPRLADNGDGTVTDRLTGLQWEQKTTDASVHDVSNQYAWSAGGAGFTAADGSAFTGFLGTLNGACFAGHCDWRLPTRDEILGITQPGYPSCTTPPCIDAIFGAVAGNLYWTGTPYAPFSVFSWSVDFGTGLVSPGGNANEYGALGVRSGL